MFIVNEPESYPEIKKEVVEFGDKKVKVTLQYLATLKAIELRLDTPVAFLLKNAIEVIKTTDGYDETKDSVRLLYQGKIFKDDVKIGVYLKADSLVQVFKTLKK